MACVVGAAAPLEARIETYCLEEFGAANGSGKFAGCVLRQGESERKIAEALEKGGHEAVSSCTSFTTGARSLGSMETLIWLQLPDASREGRRATIQFVRLEDYWPPAS